jgi:hypothetical protein
LPDSGKGFTIELAGRRLLPKLFHCGGSSLMTNSASDQTSQRQPWMAVLVALGFALLFLLLRSRQYLAVDGSLRSLVVFHDPSQRLHGNNHMLYPFWIWLWTQTASLVGLKAHDWITFVLQSQAMNAVFAAAAIGILFTVLESIAGSRIALLGSLQFGLSTAVVMHATNSAEPVMGLFFGIAAIGALVPALRAESKIGLFLVGILLTLALASYQSMALAAPVVALGCISWPGTRLKKAIVRLSVVGAGGLLSVIAVYGAAYWSQGVPLKRMAARFVTLDGDPHTYGGFSISKLVNTPFGMIRNLFHGVPADYSGTRSLLREPHLVLWLAIVFAGLAFVAVLCGLTVSGIISRVRTADVPKTPLWCGILLSVLAMTFPLFFWAADYDKLWLLPLAAFSIAVAFALQPGGLNEGRRKALTLAMVLLVVVEAAINIPQAFLAHVHQTAHIEEAREFSALVHPGDAVVVDFDDVSVLWFEIWGYGINSIVLPASSRSAAAAWLATSEKDESAKKGSLYFIGILDHDRTAWDNYIGRATGLSYNDFDCYRGGSVILRRYPFDKNEVTVRQLPIPSTCTVTP